MMQHSPVRPLKGIHSLIPPNPNLSADPDVNLEMSQGQKIPNGGSGEFLRDQRGGQRDALDVTWEPNGYI